MTSMMGKSCLAAAAAIAAVTATGEARCQNRVEPQSYDLPAQPLARSLVRVGVDGGVNISAPADIVAGHVAPALSGRFTPEQAVEALLAGSALRMRRVAQGIVIETLRQPDTAGSQVVREDDVIVTGSRIRGTAIASPTIGISRQDISSSGQATVGDVLRTIPQNFPGGQNPGIGSNVPAASGVNVGGGASVNLRGIGSDATLTLLNGHRLTYSSSRQSIDISAIPLIAIDRVEIVADGASALYGSDAVAGVVNISLLRDAEGLETRARVGGTTAGGGGQQNYSALAGSRWASGGGMVAYEFARALPIVSDQRDFARSRPGVTLAPFLKRHSVVASAHQAIGGAVTVAIDGLYNRRWTDRTTPSNAAGVPAISRTVSAGSAESFAIAPNLTLELGRWRVGIAGVYGEDRVRFTGETFVGTNRTSSAGGCYCNTGSSVELTGDGPIFRLPGGDAQLALGAGFRRNGFDLFRGAGNPQTVGNRQHARYGFAELNLPIVGYDRAVAGIDRLLISAALRNERYSDAGGVTTPKLGIVYSPIPELDLKASWGRSFRAPTFLQQYQVQSVTLLRPASVGGVGLPADATVLFASGGNPALRPERAESWSASAVLAPGWLPRAKLELSYFSTDYVDRIVSPVTFIAQALSNPIYARQVTRNPPAATQAALIAAAGLFTNGAGATYDPGKVAALVDNANVNAGRQRLRGVDARFAYAIPLPGERGRVAADLAVSYLESEQQLTEDQPVQQLAGLIFNPPHLRGRASLNWTRGGLSVGSVVSHVGGVSDTRFAPIAELGGVTTVDLTVRYRVDASRSPARGFEFALSALNLLDAKPDPIATTAFSDAAFDSANYSPVGRFLALEVARKW